MARLRATEIVSVVATASKQVRSITSRPDESPYGDATMNLGVIGRSVLISGAITILIICVLGFVAAFSNGCEILAPGVAVCSRSELLAQSRWYILGLFLFLSVAAIPRSMERERRDS